MPTPPPSKPLPVRVLVKGASTVNWTSWMGGPRQDMIFARVVEEQLLAAGRPCDVRAVTMTSERAATIHDTWQAEVLGFSPDVIVLVYGHYETIHAFIPHWLEVYANSIKASPRRLRLAFRRTVVRPAWKALARLQAALDARIGAHVRPGRPGRVATDLRTYIDHVQLVGSPLVYVFELLPPGTRYQTWFPGMTRRIDIMNRTLRGMVDDIGVDHVRYFPVGDLVAEHAGGDIDTAIPDGFHYSPAMHRHIGTALAADIESWAATQNHLTPGPERP